MLKKRYLFLMMIICLFTISTVSAEIEINDTNNEDSIYTSNNILDNSGSQLYVSSNASENGTGTKTNPFNNFQQALNNSNDGDIIYISSGVYSGDNNVNLTINKQLTIQALENGVVFDAKHASLIFNISSSNVIINGLTFKNANYEYYGILNGSAIYCDAINLTIMNTNFIDNTAYYYGGAVYFNGKLLNLSNCSFENNFASINGGALYFDGDDLIITNSVFNNNKAFKYGGAIYCNHSQNNFDIENCNFFNNSADYSGAILTNSLYMNINNSTFSKNHALTNGGGLYYNGNNLNIIDSIFNENYVSVSGGAIYCKNSEDNLNIINSSFIKNNAYSGGAFHSEDSKWNVNINNVIFTNNSAKSNGNVFKIDCGDISINKCNFTNNYQNISTDSNSKSSDSTLSIKALSVNISSCNFLNDSRIGFIEGSIYNQIINSSFLNTNGGIFIGNNKLKSKDELIGNTFINNTSPIVSFKNGGYVKNCIFISNYGTIGGGLIYSLDSIDMINNTFINNNFTTIFLDSSANNTVRSCIFINNSAINNGGAICANAPINILNSTFINNSAIKNGGAIYLSYNSNTFIKYSVFLNNYANNKLNDIYGLSSVDSCWFGNIQENLDSMLANLKYAVINNWNYLNLSANKNTLHIGESTSIILNLSGLSNSDGILNNVSSILPNMVFNVSSKNGEINNSVCVINGIGIISYVAKTLGEDIITVSYNNISTNLTLNCIKNTQKIDLNINSQPIFVDDKALISIEIKSNELISKNSKVNINVDDFNYDVDLIINGNTAWGNITTNIFNKSGDYRIFAYYDDDLNYFSNESTLTVNKIYNYELKTEITKINQGNVSIFIKLPDDATGNINLSGYTTKSIPISQGSVNFSLNNLSNGNYNITVLYSGNHKYEQKSSNLNFTIQISDIILSVKDVEKYYNGKEMLTVLLSDNNIPISDVKVKIIIDGKTYIKNTNNKGQAFLELNQTSGNYSVTTKYNDLYNISKVIIHPTITGKDINGHYRNIKYVVNLSDSNGKSLSDGTVNFLINSKKYSSKIVDGKATLNIDENHGSYMIEVSNPVTGEIIKNKIIINPIETKTTLNNVKNIFVGDSLIITAEVNASKGQVTFKINSDSKTVNLSNNKAQYTINNLTNGLYVIVAIYNDNDANYLPSSDSKSFNVSKINPKLNVIAEDIGEGQNAVFKISLEADTYGDIIININNESYNNILLGGKTIINIPNLIIGSYNYTIFYNGDYKYNNASIIGIINVVGINTILNVKDLTKYYGASDKLSAQLTDKSNNPLIGETIIFTVNGKDYERITDNGGIASMNINLNRGIYFADMKFIGNDIFDSIKTTVSIKINPTVDGKNITKIFRNGTQYYAKFIDTKGNILKNTDVKFNINGVFYTRTTNENGVARMNINLNPGTYILTAENPVNGELQSSTITVLSSIVENHDLTKYYKNASQYYIRLLDDEGNPVGAGVGVVFNINGVFYNRYSDANGYVRMNINLASGEYIITANYNGLMKSNIIKVLPILKAEDINMAYKDGSKFEATLLDGEGTPLANQEITFNINGVYYNRITDSNGIARLNINLMPGEYIITSMYSNGATISNKVTVRS